MKKILFPTDFSSCAQNAFNYAIQLADDWGGVIDMMSIYHLPISDAGSVPPDYIDQMLQEKRNQVREQLRTFTKNAPRHLIGKCRADYGLFIAQEITDAARYSEYDLVIMGTKGEHNKMEKLLGSVTTNVMMQAPCPVLAIPEEATYKGVHELAYATNFQPSDQLAIDQLMDFAEPLEANVHFVHVETKVPVSTNVEDYFPGGAVPNGFSDFTIVNNNSVVEGLDNYIKANEIDVMALFIPKRRLWERLFHSSVTKKMTLHTRIPILVFRE
jgi:nucleotide-binding universal stress UspA family protein